MIHGKAQSVPGEQCLRTIAVVLVSFSCEALDWIPPDQDHPDPFMQCMSCSSQLHVIHEFGILRHYLTSAKKEKAFVQPDLFFMNPHWLPSDHCFCFLCIHKSLFIFFPRSWILSSSSSCKLLCNLISSEFFRHLSPSPYSSRFVEHALTCKSSGYLGVLFLGPQLWVLEGWSVQFSFTRLPLASPQNMESEWSWKTIFYFTSVTVIHIAQAGDRTMSLLDSIEHNLRNSFGYSYTFITIFNSFWSCIFPVWFL